MRLNVIKIGGNIIDNPAALTEFLRDVAEMKGYMILVHGGGKVATEIGAKLGITSNYVNGRRVTDRETLDVVTMVYAGLINKNITAQLQSLGRDAIGLSGADGNILPAVKRPVGDVDYGYVGDVVSANVNSALLASFLKSGLTPVLAPLTHDGQGGMLNTNADTIAQEVAKAMSAVMPTRLIYCFEKEGVLADPNDDASVIATITRRDFETLKEQGIVSGGMIPKLENAFEAISKGVERVVIGHAGQSRGLIEGTSGTCVQ